MSSLGRALAAMAIVLGAVLLGPASAQASDTIDECLAQESEVMGELPTCTQVGEDGKWVVSWPEEGPDEEMFDNGSGTGIPGWFIAVGLLGVASAVGITIWKVSTARTLATRSGMDPGLATQMTLLTENGLDATYLASSLREPAAGQAARVSSAADRLTELKGLLEQGLINQAEFDQRRRAIIDSV